MLKRTNKIIDRLGASKYEIEGFELLESDELYGLVNIEKYKDAAMLHVIIDRWDTKAARESGKDWEDILRHLWQKGIKTIEIRKKDPNKKWYKFAKKFGFNDFANIAISRREIWEKY